MNKYSVLLFLAICVLSGCNPQQTLRDKVSPDFKADLAKVNAILKQVEVPSQIFTVAANKPEQVKGKSGTVISIKPDDLTTENGAPLAETIQVELKELTNQEELLRSNASTTSNGRLLISGGAYFINILSDGNQLKLKEGKTLSVEFPKLSNEEMSLFYGQQDSTGQINWLPADEKFEAAKKAKTSQTLPEKYTSQDEFESLFAYIDSLSDSSLIKSLSAEERKTIREVGEVAVLENKLYREVRLSQFGWINCDRFLDTPDITTVQFTFNESDSVNYAIAYLVFKDMNSIMQTGYSSLENFNYKPGFQNVPVGTRTELIAITVKNGKTYSHKSNLTIKPDETVRLSLNETSAVQLDKLFSVN